MGYCIADLLNKKQCFIALFSCPRASRRDAREALAGKRPSVECAFASLLSSGRVALQNAALAARRAGVLRGRKRLQEEEEVVGGGGEQKEVRGE